MQKLAVSDHFLRRKAFVEVKTKLRCRKSARRCGAKHVSKSKCEKHTPRSGHFWMLNCATLHDNNYYYNNSSNNTDDDYDYDYCSYNCSCNYYSYNYNYNITTTAKTTPATARTKLQHELELQLHYTTLHHTTCSSSCG